MGIKVSDASPAQTDAAIAQTRANSGSFLAWLAGEWRALRSFYLLAIVFFVATTLLAVSRGDDIAAFVLVYVLRVGRAVTLVGCAAVVAISLRALIQRNAEPVRYLLSALLNNRTRTFLSRFIVHALVLAAIMGAFLYGKTMIPEIRPFDWDVTFAAWDRIIFGTDPWRLIHPVIGYPVVTIVVDVLYAAWVPVMFIVWSAIGASERVSVDLKRHYFTATLATWVLVGLGAATFLSSAGPCFLPVLSPDEAPRFAELNAYLQSVGQLYPLSSGTTKDYLWWIYANGLNEPGGISAMPSMHNAQAALFVIAGYRLNRRLGHLLLAYAIIIFVGSVHLAWHYAVDGIAGAAMGLVIWWVVGFATASRKHEPLGTRPA